MKNNTVTTYEDSAAKLQRSAKAKLIEKIAHLWALNEADVKQSGGLQIAIINRAREIGIYFQEVSGHEQLHFRDLFDANGNVLAGLPIKITTKALKWCLHCANKLPAPVKTLDEARPAMQMMFEALGECSSPKRIGAQVAHEHNPWSELVNWASSFGALFQDVGKDPMEQWEPDRLKSFVTTTDPIVEKNLAAKKLLEAK